MPEQREFSDFQNAFRATRLKRKTRNSLLPLCACVRPTECKWGHLRVSLSRVMHIYFHVSEHTSSLAYFFFPPSVRWKYIAFIYIQRARKEQNSCAREFIPCSDELVAIWTFRPSLQCTISNTLDEREHLYAYIRV